MSTGIRRIFILALAFVVILAASLGAVLFLSLLPHISLIGIITTGVVITGLLCVAVLMVSFTYSKVCNWNNRRRVIISGEVVAYLAPNGSFIHLSAMHEQAKLPAPSSVVVDEVKPSDKETVLERWRAGMTLRDIEAVTGVSYYYVQKWTSEEDKKNKAAKRQSA
jgi:hypothetical protein